MSRFKDFGSGKDLSNVSPLSFKLHGEEFQCLPAIQGKFLIDLVSSASDESSGGSLKMISGFFGHVLTDESAERFNLLLEDKERIVLVETLSEIVSWLMTEYTNRPEEQPEVS
jgi:hypothetical protein